MKRPVAIFSQVALALSAALFALATYRFGDSNWRPVEQPLPGPGFEIAAPFELSTSGEFELEAVVPVKIDKKEVGMPEQPPIACNLLVSIDGPDIHTQQTITQLRHSGRYYFGQTDFYVSEPIELESTGKYTIHISNQGGPSQLNERGAMITLTRFRHPTESFLGAMLVRALAWVFLGLGLFGAAWSWRSSGT